MYFRRSLSYLICVALVAQPLAAQTAAPASAPKAIEQPNIKLNGSETEEYARILLEWPSQLRDSRVSLNGPMAIIQLPSAINVDPIALKAKAPNFIIAAALGADKKTIRLALSKGVQIARSRDGATEAIDFVAIGAANPPPYSKANEQIAETPKVAEAPKDGKIYPLRNWPAPNGVRRVGVEAAQSLGFTRVSLNAPGLPANGFARVGDRVALTLPGLFALDVASVRSNLPQRVKDLVRYNDAQNTSLVMDLEPGSVTRVGRQGDMVYLDILPPGSNVGPSPEVKSDTKTDTKSKGKADDKAKPNQAATNGNGEPSNNNQNAGANLNAIIAQNNSPENTSATGESSIGKTQIDPAPSGNLSVSIKQTKPELVLEFPFASSAPSAIFRRGANIYVLFGTKADFDISKAKSFGLIHKITPVKGENLAGIKIEAPDSVFARPYAIGPTWHVALSNAQPNAMRNIEIKSEIAADESRRLKALVPDAVLAGTIMDEDVGDKLLIGMALGPPSSVMAQRSFLEATVPQTWHGVVVVPRSDDLEIRVAPDGFVVVRPNGLALSTDTKVASASGMTKGAPGFIDFDNWRMGPQADFTKNLGKISRIAAIETNDKSKGIAAQLDLARFYLAWELPHEALGVVKMIKAMYPQSLKDTDVIGLQGIAQAMAGRGREALETLSSPEVANDGASQLWAAMAALSAGDPEEARKRFLSGESALAAFSPEYQAKFTLNEAIAAHQMGDKSAAKLYSDRASDLAVDPYTKEMSQLIAARAAGELGQTQFALEQLEKLVTSNNREIAARAAFAKAVIGITSNPDSRHDAIKALDGLRYAWRGDDLELDILRTLGELYIEAGDIRSGLATLADASTIRPDLPAARALRDVLAKEFRHLFLEGGADGMDPIQALALFYDFRKLTPIGPEGDQMARGLADRLVALDLLPQATELLKYQVDNRLQGLAKSQVATDLAAVYLLDNRPDEALKSIWDSRITQLPPKLNEQRRIIEAIAMAELGRRDHGLEILEFDNSKDAARVRAEIYWRNGDYANAAASAKVSLPPVSTNIDPIAAGEVLRAVLATSLSGDKNGALALAAPYKQAMSKSAYAEAFKLVTANEVPSATQLSAAAASVNGSSPFGNLIKNMRRSIAFASMPNGNEPIVAQYNGPTDANPNAGARTTTIVQTPQDNPIVKAKTNVKAAPKANNQQATRQPQRPTRQSAQANNSANRGQNGQTPKRFQAPRDPPIVSGR